MQFWWKQPNQIASILKIKFHNNVGSNIQHQRCVGKKSPNSFLVPQWSWGSEIKMSIVFQPPISFQEWTIFCPIERIWSKSGFCNHHLNTPPVHTCKDWLYNLLTRSGNVIAILLKMEKSGFGRLWPPYKVDSEGDLRRQLLKRGDGTEEAFTNWIKGL